MLQTIKLEEKSKFYEKNSIEFETSTNKSSLRNYSDAWLWWHRDIIVAGAEADTEIASGLDGKVVLC